MGSRYVYTAPSPRCKNNGKQRNARTRQWCQVYRQRIRDGLEECRWCGFVTDTLTFDHIVPEVRGGRWAFDNLTILCKSCNGEKGCDEWPELVSLQAEEAAAPPERRWVALAKGMDQPWTSQGEAA